MADLSGLPAHFTATALYGNCKQNPSLNRLPAVQHYLGEATLTNEKYPQRLRAQIERLDPF